MKKDKEKPWNFKPLRAQDIKLENEYFLIKFKLIVPENFPSHH